MSFTPLPVMITDADRAEISSQLLTLLDAMQAKYEPKRDGGMFCSTSMPFLLPDLGLTCFIDVTAISCDLNIMRPQIGPIEQRPEKQLGRRRIGLVQLLEPIITPQHLGDNYYQNYEYRMAWIRGARAKAEAGEFGYDLAAATAEARSVAAG